MLGCPFGVAHCRDRVTALVERAVFAAVGEPPVGHRESVDDAKTFERMVEMVALVSPVLKANGEFIRGVTARHPLFFLDTEIIEEVPDRTERRFSDTDSPDPL